MCLQRSTVRIRRKTSLPEEHRITVDLADVTEVWRRGSVITSWLLDLTAAALAQDPALARYTGTVGQHAEDAGGHGRAAGVSGADEQDADDHGPAP